MKQRKQAQLRLLQIISNHVDLNKFYSVTLDCDGCIRLQGHLNENSVTDIERILNRKAFIEDGYGWVNIESKRIKVILT